VASSVGLVEVDEVAGKRQRVRARLVPDPDEIRALLTDAGFEAVQTRSGVKTLRLPAPSDFLWQYVHGTPLEGAVVEMDQERRAALERDVVAGWEPYTDDGSLLLAVNVTVATAQN
jgi:hypothetical protein